MNCDDWTVEHIFYCEMTDRVFVVDTFCLNVISDNPHFVYLGEL